jgi:hypothetical protein
MCRYPREIPMIIGQLDSFVNSTGRGEVGLRISHVGIADFMLKQVQDMKYLRQAPIISN